MTHKESRGVTVQQHPHPTEKWLCVTLDCHAIVGVGRTIRQATGCKLIPGVIAELTAIAGVQDARELKLERKPLVMTISFGVKYSVFREDFPGLNRLMDEILEVVTDLMPNNDSVPEPKMAAITTV